MIEWLRIYQGVFSNPIRRGVNRVVEMMKIICVVVLSLASLGLIATVLLQSGKSAGLSGSIAGAGEQIFGSKKAKGMDALLAKLSIVCAVLFLASSLGLSFFAKF
jgi:preprotein translocase subunit SecG